MLDRDSPGPPAGGTSVDRLVSPAARPAQRPAWAEGPRSLGVFIALFGLFAAESVTGLAHEAEIDALQDLRAESPHALYTAMRVVSAVGGGSGVTIVAIAVAGALSVRRRWPEAAIFAVMMLGASLNGLLKALFDRPRPDLWMSPTPFSGLSFPSGHAMSSATLVAALVVLTWRTRWRLPVVIFGVIAVMAVGFSRLVLGAHYPSDVLGGWAFAFVWVSGVSLALTRRRSPPGPVAAPPETRAAG
jgi:membrane-associated phospholipid phosphatase